MEINKGCLSICIPRYKEMKMKNILSKIIRKLPDRVMFTHWKLKLLKNRERFKIRTSKILGYSVQYPDRLSLHFEFKDIFKNKIYHFNSRKKEPFIIDAGKGTT
jgi:hypothetical protein